LAGPAIDKEVAAVAVIDTDVPAEASEGDGGSVEITWVVPLVDSGSVRGLVGQWPVGGPV
jgi:hypothetical protein